MVTADDIKVFAKMDHPRRVDLRGWGCRRVGIAHQNESRYRVGGGSIPILQAVHFGFCTRRRCPSTTTSTATAFPTRAKCSSPASAPTTSPSAEPTTRPTASRWASTVGSTSLSVTSGSTKAVGKDGTTLSKRGGGVVRVRPDGTEMEIYSWGQRNIVDVAIDPLHEHLHARQHQRRRRLGHPPVAHYADGELRLPVAV